MKPLKQAVVLLNKAHDVIYSELEAAGSEEVKQHPTLLWHQRVLMRIEKALPLLEGELDATKGRTCLFLTKGEVKALVYIMNYCEAGDALGDGDLANVPLPVFKNLHAKVEAAGKP